MLQRRHKKFWQSANSCMRSDAKRRADCGASLRFGHIARQVAFYRAQPCAVTQLRHGERRVSALCKALQRQLSAEPPPATLSGETNLSTFHNREHCIIGRSRHCLQASLVAGMDSLPVVDQKFRPNGGFPYRRIHTPDPDPPLVNIESGHSPRTL